MNFISRYTLIALFAFAPALLAAQAESIFNEIKMNDGIDSVKSKLSDIADEINHHMIENPTFPLASEKEEHVVYSNIKTEYGTIDRAVFTFGDGTLKYVETRGNSTSVFNRYKNEESTNYLDYTVYMSDKLFIDSSKDAAWILTDGGMHTNLFTWNNPFLSESEKNHEEITSSYVIPDFIKMGGSMNALQSEFESHCGFTQVQELDGSDPNAQLQINCFGLEYGGFPRKFEARFGDEKLNVVWILTGEEEEDRIRKALVNEFGDPIFVNDEWEIFHDWQVGLRKDKPEVLLMEKSIGLGYKSSYFGQ